MKLELLTLCDFAKGEPTGKLYIIGTFDHVFAPAAPAPMPPSAIASRLRFDELEQGPHKVTISFGDLDGEKVIPEIVAPLTVQIPPGESTATVNFVVMLPPVNLRRFGEYSIDLAVDARTEASIPLYFRQAPGQLPAMK